MARGKGRGGYQQPANPAPVSGPSAMSERTDGGPGSQSQPLRVPTGLPYGQAGALEAQQQAAPMATTSPGGPAPSMGGGGSPSAPPPSMLGGLAPSPMGAPDPAGTRLTIEDDPDELIRALVAIHPHPDLYRLMRSSL